MTSPLATDITAQLPGFLHGSHRTSHVAAHALVRLAVDPEGYGAVGAVLGRLTAAALVVAYPAGTGMYVPGPPLPGLSGLPVAQQIVAAAANGDDDTMHALLLVAATSTIGRTAGQILGDLLSVARLVHRRVCEGCE
jgi:hypothetical protein